LTILGGYFGLDYLYLGSPLGAFAKFLFNTQTYGFAWFYDMINAAISQDQVRLYGPVAPVIGATGLAAGRFRDSKYPSGSQEKLDKHLNFMIYGIVLCMFGFIGGDSFLTGNFFNGVIRLFCVIFFIGIPIALFWWATNLYYYFLDTNSCIDQNWNFFGAEAPSDQSAECPSVLMIFTVWILKTALAILQMLPFFGPVASLLQELIKNLEYAYGFVEPVVKETVKAVVPLMGVVEAEKNRPVPTVAELKKPIGTSTAADMPSTFSSGLKLPGMPDMSKIKDMAGKMPDMSKMKDMAGKIPDMSKVTEMAGKMPDVSKMKEMAGKIPDMSKVTEMAGKIPDMSKVTEMAGKMPDVSKMKEMAGKMPDVSKMKGMAGKIPGMPDISKMPMVGGGETDSGILGPILVLTIGFVVVSGIIVSLRRSRQNATTKTATTIKQSGDQETDEPPHPGNLRNPAPAT